MLVKLNVKKQSCKCCFVKLDDDKTLEKYNLICKVVSSASLLSTSIEKKKEEQKDFSKQCQSLALSIAAGIRGMSRSPEGGGEVGRILYEEVWVVGGGCPHI